MTKNSCVLKIELDRTRKEVTIQHVPEFAVGASEVTIAEDYIEGLINYQNQYGSGTVEFYSTSSRANSRQDVILRSSCADGVG